MFKPLFGAVVLILACGCSGINNRLNDDKAFLIITNIASAQAEFKNTRGAFGRLDELIAAGLLPTSLSDGVEAQRRFEVSVFPARYEARAVPTARDDRYQYVGSSFFVDETGVIRFRAYGKANGYTAAGRDDPPARRQN
jgi:hypothetical protein